MGPIQYVSYSSAALLFIFAGTYFVILFSILFLLSEEKERTITEC